MPRWCRSLCPPLVLCWRHSSSCFSSSATWIPFLLAAWSATILAILAATFQEHRVASDHRRNYKLTYHFVSPVLLLLAPTFLWCYDWLLSRMTVQDIICGRRENEQGSIRRCLDLAIRVPMRRGRAIVSTHADASVALRH
jgi:hypothetical protein